MLEPLRKSPSLFAIKGYEAMSHTMAPLLKSHYVKAIKLLKKKTLLAIHGLPLGPTHSKELERLIRQNYAQARTNYRFLRKELRYLFDATNIRLSSYLLGPGRVAVFCHVYYAELLPEFIRAFKNIPFKFDLLVTTPHAEIRDSLESTLRQHFPRSKVTVRVVENRGRDIGPMLLHFREELLKYEYLCRVHTKKSLHADGAMEGWREYLLSGLLGSERVIDDIFKLFREHPDVGIVYPRTFYKLPYWVHTWLENRHVGNALLGRLGIKERPIGYFDFPAGSMFWARVKALEPLLRHRFQPEDFPQEAGQNDGTLAHAIERSFVLVANNAGYQARVIQVKDKKGVLDVSRCDQTIEMAPYEALSLDLVKSHIDGPGYKVVSFDIFDTLLVRPFLNPDHVFELLENQVNKKLGKLVAFRAQRKQAEANVRKTLSPGRDATIDQIYDELGLLLHLPIDVALELKKMEIDTEARLLKRRESMIQLLDYAYARGKRVILVSDMYLTREVLADILAQKGIRNYHDLFVSSSVGYRKDHRTLFPHLLQVLGIERNEMLHIGDDEHSDLQIPGDIRIPNLHGMKASALFLLQKWPQHLLSKTSEWPLTLSLVMGMTANRIFDNPYPRKDDPQNSVHQNPYLFGYYFYGAFVFAFVRWILHSAREDGIEHLYFLSREGHLLQRVYDLLAAELPDAPRGKYTYVSRRSVSVPAIANTDQIKNLVAGGYYFGGSLRNLFSTRLGLDISDLSRNTLEALGFKSVEEPIRLPEDRERIHRLVDLVSGRVLAVANQEHRHFERYLKDVGIFEDTRGAVVDLGYSGTVQREINKYPSCALSGYYAVTTDKAKAILAERDVFVKAFQGSFVDPYKTKLFTYTASLFYEMFLTTTEGQVESYTQHEKGQVGPVFKPIVGEDRKGQLLPTIHEGIVDFTRDMLSYFGKDALDMRLDPEQTQAPLKDLLERPPKIVAELLSGYTIDDDYCGNGLLFAIPEKDEAGRFKQEQVIKTVWKVYLGLYAKNQTRT